MAFPKVVPGLNVPSLQMLVAACAGLTAGAVAAIAGGKIALVLAGGCIALFLIQRDWRIGLCLLVVAFPHSGSELMPRSMFGVTGLNPFNLLFVGTLGSVFLARVRNVQSFSFIVDRRLWAALLLPYVLWSAYGAPSVKNIPEYFYLLDLVSFDNAISYFRDVAVRRVLFSVLFITLVATAVVQIKDLRLLINLIWVTLLGFAVWLIYFVAISGVPLSVWAQAESRSLFNGAGYHPNDMGLMFNMGYALLLFTQRETGNGGYRWLMRGGLCIVALAEMLTFSRGGYVGFAVVNLLYFSNRRQFPIILGLGTVLWLLVTLLPDLPVFQRLSLGFSTRRANDISAGRTEDIWAPLLPSFMESPLVGHGVYSILWAEATQRGHILEVVHPHSAYFEALLDLGILGTALVLGFYFYLYKHLRMLSRESEDVVLRGFFRGGAACVVVLLVQGVSGQSFVPTHLQAFLWIAAGIAFGVIARSKGNPCGAAQAPVVAPPKRDESERMPMTSAAPQSWRRG